MECVYFPSWPQLPLLRLVLSRDGADADAEEASKPDASVSASALACV